MTLHEAIGVRVDTDIKTGERLTRSEIYGRAIEFLGGLDEVARFVPFPVQTIREKLQSDPYLNNTSMSAWDKASGFQCGVFGNAHRQQYDCQYIGGGIWELYRKHGITAASNSDGVCILKEAARRLAARDSFLQEALFYITLVAAHMMQEQQIEVDDSRTLFQNCLEMAHRFESENPEIGDDYMLAIEGFATDELKKRYGGDT